ncbi:MAG: hypothetical protein AAF721_01510 [Myxococcota bacterium]
MLAFAVVGTFAPKPPPQTTTLPPPTAFPSPKTVPMPKTLKKLSPACDQTLSVALPQNLSTRFLLARGDNSTSRSAHVSVQASVRHTKRRLFVQGEVAIQERHPGAGKGHAMRNGDTKYRSTFRSIHAPTIPPGCEIASVSPASGILSGGPHGNDFFELSGTGLVQHARCRTDRRRRRHQDSSRECKDIDLGTVQVRLRPASTSCGTVVVAPQSPSVSMARHTAGDDDMGGNRPRVIIDAAVRSVGQRVDLESAVRIIEDGGDGTKFETHDVVELFDARLDAPGCRIRTVSPRAGSLVAQTGRSNEHRATLFGAAGSPNTGVNATGVIDRAWCRTDSMADDRTLVGCGEVRFRVVRIDLERAQ